MNETNKSAGIKPNSFPYADIINLPHPVSRKHERMSLENRAAQFMPFAALTGYGDEVSETARETTAEKILSEDAKLELDEALAKCFSLESQHPLLEITYFIPDIKKSGGEYVKITDNLLKLETFNRKIVLTNNVQIPFDNLYKITFL